VDVFIDSSRTSARLYDHRFGQIDRAGTTLGDGDWNAERQVVGQRVLFRPFQIPSVFDRQQDVFAGRNFAELEAAIQITLASGCELPAEGLVDV